MQKTEFESEDRMIILNSLSIFLAICYYDSKRLEGMFTMKVQNSDMTFMKLLQNGLFCSHNGDIRKFFGHHYYLFCRIATYTKNRAFISTQIKSLVEIIPDGSGRS